MQPERKNREPQYDIDEGQPEAGRSGRVERPDEALIDCLLAPYSLLLGVEHEVPSHDQHRDGFEQDPQNIENSVGEGARNRGDGGGGEAEKE